jgi:hypothetical protein
MQILWNRLWKKEKTIIYVEMSGGVMSNREVIEGMIKDIKQQQEDEQQKVDFYIQ